MQKVCVKAVAQQLALESFEGVRHRRESTGVESCNVPSLLESCHVPPLCVLDPKEIDASTSQHLPHAVEHVPLATLYIDPSVHHPQRSVSMTASASPATNSEV